MPIRTVWDAANENDGASSSGVAGAPTKQRLSLIRDGSSVREVGLAAAAAAGAAAENAVARATAGARVMDEKLGVSRKVGDAVDKAKARAGVGGAGRRGAAGPSTSTPAGLTTLESVLNAEGVVARTLGLSDSHATILLTHPGGAISTGPPGGAPEVARSLLKLSVVPFHRRILDSTVPKAAQTDGESTDPEGLTSFDVLNKSDEANSRTILAFLSDYGFDLTSESGAEYSYWAASPGGGKLSSRLLDAAGEIIGKPIGTLIGKLNEKEAAAGGKQSVVASGEAAAKMGSFTCELISPASDKQIQRASPSAGSALVEESAELYEKITRPYITETIVGGSLGWIKKIIDGTKEAERLILDRDDFLVNIDTKWRSHPDPNTTPREEWLHHPSTVDLYCLGIIKAEGVASLRDVRAKHVPTLEAMLGEGVDAIERTYGVPRDQIRCFVHYQPQFYHFHVHYTRLQNDIGCQVERGHLVSDIIQNVQSDPLYYTKRSITYKLKVTDALYGRISQHQSGAYEAESEAIVYDSLE
jgi:m7GpppX diphosphatase